MKKFTILLSLLFVGVYGTKAQKISIDAPASIAGPVDYTAAQPSGGWGAGVEITQDYLNLTLEMVDDGSTAAPELGCNTLTNSHTPGTMYAGLIFRGSCQFGTKAYNVEQAGFDLAIIANNDPTGGTIPMAGGTDGPSVNIPVIMISNADGIAIQNELANGNTVTMSIRLWSYGYDYDLAIDEGGALMPLNLIQPHFLLQAAKDNISEDWTHYYQYQAGVAGINYSAAPFDTLFFATNVIDANGSLHSAGGSFYFSTPIAPTTGQAGDTDVYILVDNDPNDTYFDMTQCMTNAQYGFYDTFAVKMGDSGLDGNVTDNTAFNIMTVTDSVLGRIGLDATTGGYSYTNAYSFNGDMEMGSLFQFPTEAKPNEKLYMEEVNVDILLNDTIMDLSGKSFDLNVYEWIDDGDGVITNKDEFTNNLKSSTVYTFPAGTMTDSNNLINLDIPLVDVDGNSGVEVTPGGMYFVACKFYAGDRLGTTVDEGQLANVFRHRFTFYNSPNNPNPMASQLQSIFIYNDTLYWNTTFGEPGLSVKLKMVDTIGINEVQKDLSIKTFPNPAVEYTNLEVVSPKVQDYISYTLTDITGRVITQAREENVKSANFRVDMSALPVGSYVIKVQTPDGYNSRKVTKK